ncbi:MAG: hypothetical protein JWR27_3102 [Aeromicrobium sp.]|nr:hypothetical protein [Aeromicrobium sp.]
MMFTSTKLAAFVTAAASSLLFATISPAAALTTSSYEKQVISHTNVKRVAHDRVEVRVQSCADRWAEDQARWMAKHHTLAHRAGRLNEVMANCSFTSASENIAYGYSSGTRVVDAWMRSSGHRANLLRTSSRYVGVGAFRDSDGTWWVAQVFGAN